jgi:bifunctional DNase/RNase
MTLMARRSRSRPGWWLALLLGNVVGEDGLVPRRGGVVMTTTADAGFVEMRLGKVVGVAVAEGEASCCVVLDGASEDRHLAIQIGQAEAFNLSATLTGQEFARPMSPQFAAGLLHALGGRVRQVRIDRLLPAFGGGTAYGATVEVENASAVELVDARPSDALNLVALVPAPIFVAPEVLADAKARLAGDSSESTLLRRALECEQMTIRQGLPDRSRRGGHARRGRRELQPH